MALSERHQQILAIMEAGIEYSTEQVAEKRRKVFISSSKTLLDQLLIMIK